MRRLLTVVARLIALALAVLLVAVTPLALLLFNADQQLLRPAAYKRALVAQRFYEQLPALAAEQAVHAKTYDNLEYLSQEEYEMVLADLLPAAWLREQSESVIDQFFAYIDSDEPDLSLTISMAQVKQRITGQEGLLAVMRLVLSFPPCTAEQLDSLTGRAPEDETDAPHCQPPDDMLDQYTHEIERMLEEVAADIPDEVDLAEGTTAETGATGDDPRQALRAIRWGMRLSPLLATVLLALIALFAVRSWKGLFRWWGIPLLLAGLIGIGVSVAVLPVVDRAIAPRIVESVPGHLADGVVKMGLQIARFVAGRFATWVGGEGALIGLLGLVMIVASSFARGRPTPPAEGGEDTTMP